MAERKKSSAMVPLIIVGAALFGLGTYQSMKPKDPEVNTGFVAPSDNPRTMQAPDAPPISKDAAARAAEDSETSVTSPSEKKGVTIELSNAPWLQAIMTGALGNFRDGVLKSLTAEQVKGTLNCAPVLTEMNDAALAGLEKVACTAKDGSQISGDFETSGDGDLKVEYPNGGMVKVSKNEGDFNVETRNSQ